MFLKFNMRLRIDRNAINGPVKGETLNLVFLAGPGSAFSAPLSPSFSARPSLDLPEI